jgi:hypothetical protein
MIINCIDDDYRQEIAGKRLLTFTKFNPYRGILWRGEDEDGLYIVVKYKRGFLYASVAETEIEAEITNHTVGATDGTLLWLSAPDLDTREVLDFLDWEIDESDILDW